MRQDAVFAAVNFASRWLWTRERKFLTNSFGTESSPYEFLKETVAFWQCYLTADLHDGTLHDENDCVGELCDRTNQVDSDPLMTLALLRFATNALLSASVALGRDASLRRQWQALLCTLAPYPTATHNGTTVFVASANSTELEASMAIYPGSIVAGDNCTGNSYSYEYAANTTRSSIEQMGADFFRSYSLTKGFSAALLARVDKSLLFPNMLLNLRPCSDADNRDRDMNGKVCLQRNGLADNHNGGGLETIGGMDLVHNLVLQSRDGVLRLFPWLSDDFHTASFRRLRALGGFVVSANYSAVAGGVQRIEITFPDEERLCEVEVPHGWGVLHICEGSKPVVAKRQKKRTSSFWGEANLTYVLQPTSCGEGER